MRRVVALIASALALLWADTARAGGAEFPDIGARAQGRGGAFVAKANDLTALVFNPAGLAQLRGTYLHVSTSLAQQRLCFTRAGTYPGTPGPFTFAGQPYPKVCRQESGKGVFFVPVFALASDFGLERWTFAFGGTGPHAIGTRVFPRQVTVQDSEGRPVRAPSPQRYDLVSTDVTVIFFMLGAAYRPVRWLDIGLTVEAQLQTVEYNTTVPATNDPTDPDGDALFGINTQGWAATGKLGVLVHPVAGLHFGLSVRLPVKTHTKGKAVVRLPGSLAGLGGSPLTFIEGKPQAEVESNLPLIVRAGVRYGWRMKKGGVDAPDLGDIELDLQYERWRSFKAISTKLNAVLLGSELEEIGVAHFWRDVGEIRLGGSFTIPRRLGTGWLTIRAGWSYGSEASPVVYTRLDYAAWARMGAYFGLGYSIFGFDIDLAVSYQWLGRGKFFNPFSFKTGRNIARSCVQPINPFSSGGGPPTFCDVNDPSYDPSSDISAGRWRGSIFNVSLGLKIRFDEIIRRARTLKKKKH